jgi:hypothetical protein
MTGSDIYPGSATRRTNPMPSDVKVPAPKPVNNPTTLPKTTILPNQAKDLPPPKPKGQ